MSFEAIAGIAKAEADAKELIAAAEVKARQMSAEAENEGKAGEHEERPVMQESGKRRARGFGGCRGTRRSCRDGILLFVLIGQARDDGGAQDQAGDTAAKLCK